MKAINAIRMGGVEVLPRKHFGQHTLERSIFLFDSIHGRINDFADVWLFGLVQQERPAGFRWDEEDVFGLVFIFVFWIQFNYKF